MNDKQAVTVRLLDREYHIACQPEERQQLLEAATYLDDQMRKLRESMNLPGTEKVAVLAALNIASDFLATQNVEQQYSGEVATRVQQLREKLDQGLKDSA